MIIKKHLDLLGFKAVDKETGYSGVIDSICFDLYGHIYASIRPPMDNEGKLGKAIWSNVLKLVIKSKKPVENVPDFDYGLQAGRKTRTG